MKNAFETLLEHMQEGLNETHKRIASEFENLQHINFDAMTEGQKKRYKYLEGMIEYDKKNKPRQVRTIVEKCGNVDSSKKSHDGVCAKANGKNQ